jgi:hypothetical protein
MVTDELAEAIRDNCPLCLTGPVPPRNYVLDGGQVTGTYECRCGYSWSCSWSLDFLGFVTHNR